MWNKASLSIGAVGDVPALLQPDSFYQRKETAIGDRHTRFLVTGISNPGKAVHESLVPGISTVPTIGT
jgi:hypothetical protein